MSGLPEMGIPSDEVIAVTWLSVSNIQWSALEVVLSKMIRFGAGTPIRMHLAVSSLLAKGRAIAPRPTPTRHYYKFCPSLHLSASVFGKAAMHVAASMRSASRTSAVSSRGKWNAVMAALPALGSRVIWG